MIELASALRAEVDRAAAYFRSLGEADSREAGALASG
jgi:hypothetical protein